MKSAGGSADKFSAYSLNVVLFLLRPTAGMRLIPLTQVASTAGLKSDQAAAGGQESTRSDGARDRVVALQQRLRDHSDADMADKELPDSTG
jgi:hypothetical protein